MFYSAAAMTLVRFPVVKAGGIHALSAPLALTTSGVDFHADAFVDFELVDTWSERGNRAHIFVAGREILVEGQAALNDRRRAAVNDLKVGCADWNCVDADQNFSSRSRSLSHVRTDSGRGPTTYPGLAGNPPYPGVPTACLIV
jgi:hypothetical protein